MYTIFIVFFFFLWKLFLKLKNPISIANSKGKKNRNPYKINNKKKHAQTITNAIGINYVGHQIKKTKK